MRRSIRINRALRIKCTEEVKLENKIIDCLEDAVIVEIEEEYDKIIGVARAYCVYHLSKSSFCFSLSTNHPL